MCGEHRPGRRGWIPGWGSSPHVRGAPLANGRDIYTTGIIPACAGSTLPLIRSPTPYWDHPRMCGEHSYKVLCCTVHWGSSPHVRGALLQRQRHRIRAGIIPACAGSTWSMAIGTAWDGDHPRMCGEHRISVNTVSSSAGSSPHVRGAHSGIHFRSCRRGIIPACAGSTSIWKPKRSVCWDHPRMCGEHVITLLAALVAGGSSPHVRGAHFENSIIPRKRKDNWLFFIQFRFENFLAFRYLLALLHPFLGVPTKDPSFASLGRLINCNPSQSTGDQSAPYTLKAICCSFLAE